jgi:hypothetical protein
MIIGFDVSQGAYYENVTLSRLCIDGKRNANKNLYNNTPVKRTHQGNIKTSRGRHKKG